MKRKVLTLCLIEKDGNLLLGMKKRGFGIGLWNGFGGHVEDGETIEEAMLREVWEEAGIELTSYEHRGVLEFIFKNGEEVLETHLYHSSAFTGEPTESDEMTPQWFSVQEIPFEMMWPDDRHWFPMFLEGKRLRGTFHFQDNETILEHALEELLD